MSYDYTTDFLGLLRLTAGGVRSERMPGLDWVVSALVRAGMFALSVGQEAPTVNTATTLWFKPAIPSWTAEGTLYIWNAVTQVYEVATPTLWQSILSSEGATFQSLPDANNSINAGVSLAAVERAAPVATAIVLPTIAAQYVTGRDIAFTDFSTAIAATHTMTFTTPDGSTIMQRAQLQLISTPDYLANVRLRPSPDLDSWVFV